jgi:predicted secreted protein
MSTTPAHLYTRLSFMLLLSTLALLNAACRDSGNSAASPTPADPRTACNEARRQFCDPNRRIQVAAGQRFTLVFHANASIGDQWRIEVPVDQAVLRFDDTDYVSDSRGLAGSGRTEMWTFTALAPGETHIRLGNFYRNGPVTAHRDYAVTVR